METPTLNSKLFQDQPTIRKEHHFAAVTLIIIFAVVFIVAAYLYTTFETATVPPVPAPVAPIAHTPTWQESADQILGQSAVAAQSGPAPTVEAKNLDSALSHGKPGTAAFVKQADALLGSMSQ